VSQGNPGVPKSRQHRLAIAEAQRQRWKIRRQERADLERQVAAAPAHRLRLGKLTIGWG
jgi:hypothetical protein